MNNLLKLLVLLFGVTIYSQDTLSVKDGAYGYDKDFSLEINFKTQSDIKAVQFDLSYPNDNFTYNESFTLGSDRLGSDSDHQITVKQVNESKLRILIYSPSNKLFPQGDGTIVSFDFHNSLNFGDYAFNVTNLVASLSDNSSASVVINNGTITTLAPNYNQDNGPTFDFGSVYIGQKAEQNLTIRNAGNSDLTISLHENQLSTFSMNEVEWPKVLKSAEELNIVFEFEAKTNGTFSESLFLKSDDPLFPDKIYQYELKAYAYNENKLVVENNVDAYNDVESKIKVAINGDEDITSFQFDLYSSNSNISFVDSSTKLLNTSTDHVISSKLLTDSNNDDFLRVISYSPTNAVFKQPIGDIVEFSVLPTGLDPGNYQINITNPVLTNSGLVDVTSSTENGGIILNAAKLQFVPDENFNLGEVLKNTTKSHKFTIRNEGTMKLTISEFSSLDPNLFISDEVPIEIEKDQEQEINFDLLVSSSESLYKSNIIVTHDSGLKSDTLNISASVSSRNTVQLSDAALSNGTTKNISLDLLNSDSVKGLQFDLTFPKESKTINYTLTADGSSSYVFAEKNNAKNPDLVLYVGDVINFKNNTSNHPFYIVTNNDDGYDASNELAGVQNQGVTEGTLTLDLSDLNTGTYYYVCGPHKSMTGKITVLPKFSLSVDKSNLNSERASDFNISNSILSSSSRKNRILIYSDTNTNFAGNIGEILNIPVTVSDISDETMKIAEGKYEIVINSIIISGDNNINTTSIEETKSYVVFANENLFSPVIDSNQSVSINENPTADIFFYTVNASDSDDNSFINDFKIVSGNVDETFGITSSKGELYVKVPSNIDFENKESYSLGITVSDGSKISQEEIVLVNIIDDPNVFVTEDLTIAVYRDSSESGIVTDDYNTLNNIRTSTRSSAMGSVTTLFSIDGGSDKDFFKIETLSGALSFKSAPSFSNPLDANKDNIYEVTIKAENIDDTSEDSPVITSRKSISILEDNTSVTEVRSIISSDSDGDGKADSDVDGDGIIDTEDNCPLTANPDQLDSDGNGEGDVCQDTDGDGVLDYEDICPIIANPGQEDSDNNGIGDVCEDSDGDGVSDTDDNCPLVPNTDQADLNNNGIGDVCELSPVSSPDVLTITEDAALTSTNVITNDTDGDGDTLSLTAVTTDGSGTVAVNADGLSVDYTPAANFNGTETITYTVSDGALTSTGTFTITVSSVNDTPVAVDDALTIDEDSALTSTNVITNDTDVEGDTLSLTAVTTDGSGTVAVNADGLSVDYTPAANFNGTETITYTVSDGALTSTGTFTITVSSVNDTPVAVDDALTIDEDSALTSTNVITNDTDVEGDTLSLTAVTTDGSGTVAVNADGLSVDYTPAANFNGTETITYTVSDGALTSTGTFTITVSSVNDTPVAVDDALTIDEDSALTSTNVITNDTDVEGDTLSLTAVTTDGSGTVAVNADGLSVDYTPAANFNGTETITYTVSDGALTSTGTFTITVSSVNDTPVAVDDALTIDEDSALTSTNVITNDTDVEGDTLSLTAVTTDGSGTVAVNADGLSVDYTPAANFNGTETITYTVSDGALTSTGTFTITVSSVNDTPVAVDDALTIDEDSALTSTNVITNDTDVEGDTLSLTAVTTDGSGTVAVNADGLSVDYTPAANFNGTETITYTVSDGALTSTGTFTITVSSVNDTPVAIEQSVTTEQEATLDIVLEGTDIDGDELTYLIVDNPKNGSLTNDKGNVNYTPNTGYVGDDSFTFKVNDGTIDSEKVSVLISVTSNDLDRDGVLNSEDQCPDTPEGSTVDFNGCAIFTLPLDNNKVSVMSSTCIGNTDGSIGLSVEDASYSYSVTVTGQDDPITLGGETKTASVTGLGKGTYTVCFTVEGQDGYEQCFEVNIEEPKALSAFIDVNNDTRQTSIQLSGSSTYTVDINGESYDVKGDRFTTNLPTGLSIITISTDLDCQGIIEREVFISEDILYYPNPTPGDVNVYVNGQDTKVMMTVFSAKGDLIFSREQDIQSTRKTDLDLGGVPAGTYLVTLDGPTVRKTFKIVKR